MSDLDAIKAAWPQQGYEDEANSWPEMESLDPQEWKLLFMLLCENRSKLPLAEGLTEYGATLLQMVQRKIGILVVGVDPYAQGQAPSVDASKTN